MYTVEIIEYASPEYDETLKLRYKVLRAPLGLDFTIEQIEEEWNQHFFVATDSQNEILGCLVMQELSAETVKMRQVAVTQEFQGKGLGSLMIQFAENWARRKGYQNISLHARDLAVPFYLKHNYSALGDEFFEVGIPHREMTKKL